MLAFVKHQQMTIKGHDLLTSDLIKRFNDIQEAVAEGSQQVAWADQPVDSGATRLDITSLIDLPVTVNSVSSINTPKGWMIINKLACT